MVFVSSPDGVRRGAFRLRDPSEPEQFEEDIDYWDNLGKLAKLLIHAGECCVRTLPRFSEATVPPFHLVTHSSRSCYLLTHCLCAQLRATFIYIESHGPRQDEMLIMGKRRSYSVSCVWREGVWCVCLCPRAYVRCACL